MRSRGSTARLVSLNVGLPRDVAWQGRTVRTGIWKQPVQGRHRARRLNIDGDGQGDLAGHGGEQRAVLVYQTASYDDWQDQLGRRDFVYGQFGENFTVDGLPDDEVCIGDRYRVGGALFEVTQPRVTCYRLGIRMNEPKMAALLVAYDRPGFYLRVLEEGDIGAEDEIVRVAQGPEGVTVAAASALLYKPSHPTELLEQALRIPALSPGWRGSFEALLQQARSIGAATGNAGLSRAASSTVAWPGFRPMRVVEKTRESISVTSLRFEPADGRPAAAALPGQFVALRLKVAEDAPALLRSYSLSGAPRDTRYRISVKRNAGGLAGAAIADAVQVGDVLDMAAPRGSFTLQAGDGPVVFLSAGIGVTPVLAMLLSLAEERSPRPVWWLHGTRNRAEHVFAEEVRTALSALPRARSHIRYSDPAASDRLGVDFDATGRLDPSVLADLGVPHEADFNLCGPAAFMAALSAGLAACGVPSGRIHREEFGSLPSFAPGVVATLPGPPHQPKGPVGPGPLVSFARSGLNVRWGPAYRNLLELAEACDVPVRWSCRTGVCHTCETALITGAVSYEPEPIDPPGADNVLICCARPDADVAIDL